MNMMLLGWSYNIYYIIPRLNHTKRVKKQALLFEVSWIPGIGSAAITIRINVLIEGLLAVCIFCIFIYEWIVSIFLISVILFVTLTWVVLSIIGLPIRIVREVLLLENRVSSHYWSVVWVTVLLWQIWCLRSFVFHHWTSLFIFREWANVLAVLYLVLARGDLLLIRVRPFRVQAWYALKAH